MEDGEEVAAANASSAYGRVGYTIRSSLQTNETVRASITLPAVAWPPGGIKLRLRAPAFPAKHLSAVTVGGTNWPHFNSTEETVLFAAAPADANALHKIVATWA